MKPIRLLLALSVCLISTFALSTTSYAYTNGDTNDDGIHSIDDARLTLQFVAGVEEPDNVQKHAADIDRDGCLTTDDAIEILRIASDLSIAPPHEYSAWFTTKEPTCTTEGTMVCTCTICDEVFYGKIPTLPHSISNGVCSVCGFAEEKPNIIYNAQKPVCFGDNAATIKSKLGQPQDTLVDTNLSGEKITILIYCTDYSNLGIFTLTDNSLTQFYSNNANSRVVSNEESYTLNNASTDSYEMEIDAKVNITQYIDTNADDGEYVYSYLATVGNYYTFANYTDRRISEKLNFHLTNGLRALHGQKALVYCSDVAEVAYKHSLDMATRDYFDHYTPEGLSPGDRITAAGIEWYGYGENIAAGYADAYEVADGWYNSPGHRKNLLSQNHTHMGVGIARKSGSSYRYYSTQNFYTYY